jgi:hypothetical protein
MSANTREDGPIQEAAARLQEAAAAKKCWACGCLHGALDTVERTLPVSERSAVPEAALRTARTHLTPIGYDRLGFDVCFPAIAVNVIHASRGGPLAAGGLSDSAVRALLHRWAGWHWFRTGLGTLGFFAALRALHER